MHVLLLFLGLTRYLGYVSNRDLDRSQPWIACFFSDFPKQHHLEQESETQIKMARSCNGQESKILHRCFGSLSVLIWRLVKGKGMLPTTSRGFGLAVLCIVSFTVF